MFKKYSYQSELIKETSSIKQKIDDLNVLKRILKKEVDFLRKTIDEFVDHYYSRIGCLLKHFPQDNIEKTKSYESSDIFAQEEEYQEIISSDLNIDKKIADLEIKAIYRKLARICHPDSNHKIKQDKEIFSYVSRAYNNKNLNELIRLEKLICSLDEEQINLNYEDHILELKKEYAQIIMEVENLEKEKFTLINSKANMLRHKALKRKLLGEDLIEEIRVEIIKALENKSLSNNAIDYREIEDC